MKPSSHKGRCDLCHRESELGLICDHDHDTDEIRGWLCTQCNLLIGQFGDSVEGFQRVINYLTRPRSGETYAEYRKAYNREAQRRYRKTENYRQSQERNREHNNARTRAWQEAHREQERARSRAYYHNVVKLRKKETA